MEYPVKISLCGMGGQGIILSAVIMGTTMVKKNGLYATQTQSYGSEARGGQCQAELIIDREPINSPVAEKKDILVALFQEAYEKYIGSLKPDGILIYDPDLVSELKTDVARSGALPATQMATNLGNRMSANMIVLGYLAAVFDMFSKEQLIEIVKAETNPRFLDSNLKAIEAGYLYGLEHGGPAEGGEHGSL